MAGFLYFIPEAGPIDKVDKIPSTTGIDYLLDYEQGLICNQLVGPGPGGRKGSLFCLAADHGKMKEARCLYDPAKQRWREIHEETSWWLGYWEDSPPTSEDLVRPRRTTGTEILLENDEYWFVPVLPINRDSAFDGREDLPEDLREILGGVPNSTLPHSFVVVKGAVEKKPQERFQGIIEDAEKLYLKLFGEEGIDLEGFDILTEIFVFSAKVLGINYRVGIHEVSGNGIDLFNANSDIFVNVAKGAFGIFQAEAIAERAEKKKLLSVETASDVEAGASP